MTRRQTLAPGGVRDRATIVAGSLFLMMAEAAREWFDGAPLDRAAIERRIADRLRDEFSDIEQQLASDYALYRDPD
jgi:hypothetical protein